MFHEEMEKRVAEIRKSRKKYDRIMFQSGISAFQELEKLEAGAMKSGSIDQKYKELIALGISISQSCYG